jgi:glucose/arabinose dehydrogenase
MFGPDGHLYVGTGDAGRPALAQNAGSLAGKVLRVDPIGDPPRDNPRPGSAVWSSGHRRVDGLCTSADTTSVFEVETGAAGADDEVNRIIPGDDDGYPNAGPTTDEPARTMPAGYRSPGGCAVLQGRLWVTSLDGKALLAAPLTGSVGAPVVGKFAPALAKKYGRLRTVVAAPDGALWMTTSNRDGRGTPVAADERVIRFMSSSASASSPA